MRTLTTIRVELAGPPEPLESVVAADETITDGPYPEGKEHLGGFSIVDVPSREEALEWAVKIAAACRCAQDVRELPPDPQRLIEEDPTR